MSGNARDIWERHTGPFWGHSSWLICLFFLLTLLSYEVVRYLTDV